MNGEAPLKYIHLLNLPVLDIEEVKKDFESYDEDSLASMVAYWPINWIKKLQPKLRNSWPSQINLESKMNHSAWV